MLPSLCDVFLLWWGVAARVLRVLVTVVVGWGDYFVLTKKYQTYSRRNVVDAIFFALAMEDDWLCGFAWSDLFESGLDDSEVWNQPTVVTWWQQERFKSYLELWLLLPESNLKCFSGSPQQSRGKIRGRWGGAAGEALCSAGSVHLQTQKQLQQDGARSGTTVTPTPSWNTANVSQHGLNDCFYIALFNFSPPTLPRMHWRFMTSLNQHYVVGSAAAVYRRPEPQRNWFNWF